MSKHPVIELHSLGSGCPIRIAMEPNVPFRFPQERERERGTREETTHLMMSGGGAATGAQAGMSTKNGKNNNGDFRTFCIATSMCVVILTVLTMTVVVYVRVEYLIQEGATKVMPYLDAGIKDISRVLGNSATMSGHVAQITREGQSLAINSVPKLISMLNQTQRLMGRFEQFSSQPSINIGMG